MEDSGLMTVGETVAFTLLGALGVSAVYPLACAWLWRICRVVGSV